MYNKEIEEKQKSNGYIALISVLIISAVVLLVAINASLFGISESDVAAREYQSSKAFYLAMLCAEDGLMKLKEDINYGGNETLNIGDGQCSILPIEGSGNFNRIVKSIGVFSNQIRKIKIEINRVNPKMEIRSWEEVGDF
ncbi:hypothetical protein J7K24_03740 [bacterium]|nr:hypothetical protein [bacterium]